MAYFKYKVRDAKGQAQKGLIEAGSDKDAAKVLRNKGFFVVSLSKTSKRKAQLLGAFNKIKSSEIVDFTRQLSTMIDAGLPLTRSLSILVGQTKNEKFRKLLQDILESVESGLPLADALQKKSKYFSRIYIALIRSGEASGTLDDVLQRLAQNLEKNREFRNKIKGAMIYPVIIMIGMAIVMFIMMAFVVPKLTGLYSEFEIELPISTQILISISDFFANFWLGILVGVFGLGALFLKWRKTKSGKPIWDKFLLSLPIFGELQKEIVLIETARTLGVLVGSGLPIIEALEIVSDSIDNTVYRSGFEEAIKDVEKGYPLGASIEKNENFPAIFSEMITIGEETGKLDETLQRLGAFFETKSDETVKGLTTAIEPLIMIILGLGVGFLVLAIIMPIYNLTSALK